MIGPADIGGVHIKYLHHCRRQLWLYGRGFRPEHLSDPVQLGEAVNDTSYTRTSPVDLGAARLDFIDGQNWVHEVKSSASATKADEAQAMHYCFRLKEIGIDARGGILHYPKTRRTRPASLHPDRGSTGTGRYHRSPDHSLRGPVAAPPGPRGLPWLQPNPRASCTTGASLAIHKDPRTKKC